MVRIYLISSATRVSEPLPQSSAKAVGQPPPQSPASALVRPVDERAWSRVIGSNLSAARTKPTARQHEEKSASIQRLLIFMALGRSWRCLVNAKPETTGFPVVVEIAFANSGKNRPNFAGAIASNDSIVQGLSGDSFARVRERALFAVLRFGQ